MNQSTFLKRLFRNESGAIVVFVAIAMGVLVTASGMAYEMSKYSQAKSRLNNAVDQALLAAAAANAGDPLSYATQYLRSNLGLEAAKFHGDVLRSDRLTVYNFTVEANGDRTEWTATAQADFHTTFGGILGMDVIKMDHTAKVAWDDTVKTELVAMVDVSGTMCANFERTQEQDGSTVIDFVPDRNCTKLNQMKEALSNITTIGVGVPPGGVPSYAVGVVPYSYKLALAHPDKVPASLVQVEKDAGYGDNYYSSTADAENGGPALPKVISLTEIGNQKDKEDFIRKVDALSTPAQDGNGYQEFVRPFMKRSSLGALFSGFMLDPDQKEMFDGATPREFGAANTRKIVIMMTDSANLGCCFTNWPETNFRNNYIYSYNPDHSALVGTNGHPGICKALKEKGIEVFTLLLDVDRRDMDARGNEIVDSFKACASSDDHAFEVARDDKQKLKEAYTIIGKSIMQLRLVE